MMNGMKRGWFMPALAVLGLGDSLYLAILHWQGEVPPCGGYAGCAQVNSSPFAEIFGVPVAALGAALYAALLVIGLWRLQAQGVAYANATVLLYSLLLSGALFMAYLTGVEFLILHAFCYWCLALAAITILLLAMVTREIWVFSAQTTPATP